MILEVIKEYNYKAKKKSRRNERKEEAVKDSIYLFYT
jgi:hypothetical protein